MNLNYIKSHKIISSLLGVAFLFVSYYGLIRKTANTTQYALAKVEKGTLVVSVSSSGQVSASNQVDIKPKVSGDVIYANPKNGQAVPVGTLLVQLDSRDAQKAVRDAEINLENSQISLSKLKLSQQSNAPKLQDSTTMAQNNLSQSYQNGFNEVANSFLDMPNVLTGIHGILYDSTVGTSGQSNTGAYQNLMDRNNEIELTIMINLAVNDSLNASTKYNKNLDDYKNTTRYSPHDQIVSMIDETLETAKTMSQSVKDEQNILDAVVLSLKQYLPNT